MALIQKHHVFLYVPNLIGYTRVVLSLVSLWVALDQPKLSVICYFLSFVCDFFDGYFARWFSQCSSFGAVLDMVTDRCSTAGLLFILSHLYPKAALSFLFLMILDFASHWVHMYSSKGHHKQVDAKRNLLLRLYYGNYAFFGFCCVGTELFYIFLYVLKFFPYLAVPGINVSVQEVCFIVCLPACVLKNIINVVQLLGAASAIAESDAQEANEKAKTR